MKTKHLIPSKLEVNLSGHRCAQAKESEVLAEKEMMTTKYDYDLLQQTMQIYHKVQQVLNCKDCH